MADQTSQELQQKIKSLNVNESNHDEIFKQNKWDAVMFFILFILGSLIIPLIVILNKALIHAVIAAISYIISIVMAVLLNSDDITMKKRMISLIVSYLTLLSLMFISSAYFHMSVSSYITITTLSSSWIIICIVFCYEFMKQRNVKKVIKYLWEVKSLLIPVFAHFADIATDFGATYEYYQRSQSHDDNNTQINYEGLFLTSIFILFFHRIMGLFIIWQYTRSIIDAGLQFMDLFLIKTLAVEWKLKYKEAGRVHKFVHLLESIFESGPQAIISLYIIVVDNNTSLIIWLSNICSIFSIAARTISEDTRFFSNSSNSKYLEWDTNNGTECNKSRCVFCNHPYLVRVIWRFMEITSYILLCALFWIQFGGIWLFVWIMSQVVIITVFIAVSTLHYARELNIYWLNGLLAIPPSSWSSYQLEDQFSTVFGSLRALMNILTAVYILIVNPDTIYFINFGLMFVSCVLYIWFVGRNGCANCKGHSTFNVCGSNWVDTGVVTTLSIAGCDDVKEILDLKLEGIEMTQYFKEAGTWEMYPRPNDLVKIVKELNYDLSMPKRNYFILISRNRNLDPNITEKEINMVIEHLRQFSDIHKTNHGYSVIEKSCLWHTNVLWIKTFLELGVSFDYETCIDRAKRNVNGGKNDIITFFDGKII
eukprot:33495_1